MIDALHQFPLFQNNSPCQLISKPIIIFFYLRHSLLIKSTFEIFKEYQVKLLNYQLLPSYENCLRKWIWSKSFDKNCISYSLTEIVFNDTSLGRKEKQYYQTQTHSFLSDSSLEKNRFQTSLTAFNSPL